MVQINLSLFFIAAIATISAHPLERREDTDLVGSAFSRRFYSENPIIVARDVEFDLEQREPSWDAVLHPIRTWREHRRIKAVTAAAKAEAIAHVKEEHVEADLQRREPFWDAIFHPIRTWKEHRRVKEAAEAAKAEAIAHIKQEHAVKAITDAAKADAVAHIKEAHVDADLQRREPLWNAVFHPMRTWREHRQVKAVVGAAEANAKAHIKEQHAEALGVSGATETLAERSFDDFDLEVRDFDEEYY